MSPSGNSRLDRVNSKAEATTGQGVELALEHEESLVRSNSRRKEEAVMTAWRPKDVLTLVALLSLFALVLISMGFHDANSSTLLIAYLAVVASIPVRV